MNLKEMIGQMQTGLPQSGPSSTSGVPHKAPKKKGGGNPLSHLKAAQAAHQSGNSKAAKGHAFNFIKALKDPEAATAAPMPAM